MSTARGSCLGEVLVVTCLGDTEWWVLLFQLQCCCPLSLVLDLYSDVSACVAVILGFMLAEGAVRLGKKRCQACKEVKKKMPKVWLLAEGNNAVSSGPVCRLTYLCSIWKSL